MIPREQKIQRRTPNLYYELTHSYFDLAEIANKIGVSAKDLRRFAKRTDSCSYIGFLNVWQAYTMQKCIGGHNSNYLYSVFLYQNKPKSKKEKRRSTCRPHPKSTEK